MTTPFVTGPSFAFIGNNQGSNFVFLGTCENSPQVATRKEFAPLFNALGGTRIPSDQSFQGESATVRLDLTKYSETLKQVLEAQPQTVPGTSQFGDLGRLMLTEGGYSTLVLTFPYFNKPFYAAQGMPAGITFVAAWNVNEDLGNLNTEARKVSLFFNCQRVFNAQTLAWTLYVLGVPAGLPAIS